MTTAADDAAERAFEAVLAGRPAPFGAPGSGAFAAFTGAVRATANQPGRPNTALAELLANGLIVDQPSPSPRTAHRRRRRMWFFTAIFAKIASAGAIAQAATGAGIVLVGFTGAGAAGVLPAPVQHTFATVVDHVTPLTAPDPQGSAAPAADSGIPTDSGAPSDSGTPTATTTGSADAAQVAAQTPSGWDCDLSKPFGVCVARHAKAGDLSAGQVSTWARYYQAHRPDSHDAQESEAPESPEATESDSRTDGTGDVAPQRTASSDHSGDRHGGGSQHGNGHGDH